MCLIIHIGTGLTRLGGASTFLYDAHILVKRKSTVVLSFSRGSLAPTPAIVCPIARMEASTVRLLTFPPLGAISPERYRTAKIWRRKTGSEMVWSKGSMAMLTQNVRHRSQCKAVARSVPAHTPELTHCRAVSRSARAAARLVGSRASKIAAVDN